MRFVVIGAGAIGGVIGGRLYEHGHDVVLLARGAHLAAIQRGGLRLEDPDRTVTLDVPATETAGDVSWSKDDVAILAMKSQDTAPALETLRAVAPSSLPVVCAQNGVDNERQALRRFRHVYGIHVMCPATHLEPGVVQVRSTPVSGLLDVGRYPAGVDATAQKVAAALSAATFDSRPAADIMRWKYGKLLMNLGNAVQIVCGLNTGTRVASLVRTEGTACLEAAGIPFVSREEDAARRHGKLTLRTEGSELQTGGSTWQSVARGAGSIETDYLNGEIILLGRLHDVPTPANELLAALAADVAGGRIPAGSVSEAAFFSRLDRLPS